MIGEEWDSKIDIFSFGAILYSLLFQKERIFYIEIMKNQEDLYKSLEIEVNNSNFENKLFFTHILNKCLSKDPKNRPNAIELLKLFEN